MSQAHIEENNYSQMKQTNPSVLSISDDIDPFLYLDR